MKLHEARHLLQVADEEEPVLLPLSSLPRLSVADVPDGISIQVGAIKRGIAYLEWSGKIWREGGSFVGEADHTWTRKYWYGPLGLEQYLDLVRRAVETRKRIRGDVSVTQYDDDGAFINFCYRIETHQTNVGKAFHIIQEVSREVEEVATQAAEEVGQRTAEIAARLSAWGKESLDGLVDTVETAASSDDKGRALEELCSRLFETVRGLTITGRIRTETEEIDISVLNGSSEPRLHREAAVILVECKNWTGKCGKNEFVIFRQKLENRHRRCSLGFLVSWNGFTGTITKEMLRGSHEETLIVPLRGEDIRRAVRSNDFQAVLNQCWDAAVHL